MKKLIIIFMAVTFVASLLGTIIGCGGGKDDPDANLAGSEEDPEANLPPSGEGD
mgnify:FL=1